MKISSWPSRSKSRGISDRQDGMVLLVVMIVATLLLIGLTASLPSVYQEGQREREEEVIFRGTQYARAIALFHKQFGRYPVSIKELMGTNGMRFLRQEYTDPLDPKGKWRFVHVNAGGVLLDSKDQPLPGTQNNGNPAGIGGSGNSGLGGNTSTGNSNLSFGNSGSSFGNSSSSGFTLGSGSSESAGGVGSNSTSQTSTSSPSSSTDNQIQGAYIAGVAPTSHHESIILWPRMGSTTKKYHHYDEWEFVGIDMGVFGIQVGLGGAAGGPTGVGQQNPGQGNAFSPGTPNNGNGTTPGYIPSND